MTISEILAEVDEIKPNTYDDNIKIKWLSELDGKVFNELVMTHEHEDGAAFTGYTEADMEKELLIPFPYTDTYRNWLFAMIDYSNGETDRFGNSMLMFNNSYSTYSKHFCSTNKAIQLPYKLF